jgi:hypothetical protein
VSRANRSASLANESGSTLMATSRFSLVSVARHTPIPPTPIRAVTAYGPRRIPRVRANRLDETGGIAMWTRLLLPADRCLGDDYGGDEVAQRQRQSETTRWASNQSPPCDAIEARADVRTSAIERDNQSYAPDWTANLLEQHVPALSCP